MLNLIKDTPNGKIVYNPMDKYVGKSIEMYGDYQIEEKKVFSKYVNEESVVLDIGANIGTHTLWFAQNSKLVIAFEPQRYVFQMLCANMALNSIQNADCKQLGVGSTREIIEIAFIDPETENNFGGFSLKDHSIEKAKEETGAVDLHGEKIAVCRIDDIGLDQCDFIKIDVEGMEPEVLAGGRRTILELRPYIYMEVDRVENWELISDQLLEYNYTAYPSHPPLYSEDYEGENIFGDILSQNCLCIPTEFKL
jgi:FkbM family methyltransferase